MATDVGGAIGHAEAASGEEQNLNSFNIVLDRDGRPAGVESGVRYGYQRFEGVFRGPVDSLAEDCVSIFDVKPVGSSDEYSHGQTYFLPAQGAEPVCELESVAKAIYTFHTKDAVGVNHSKSCAEWWVQAIDEPDDIGLHWDRDYILEEEAGINIHPHLTTITYLTDSGAPTLAVDLKPPAVSGDDSRGAGPTSNGFLSFPKKGAHASFDGRLLHCAPAELSRSLAGKHAQKETVGQKRPAARERITLLVNIWLNYQPIHAERFPRDRTLTTPLGTTKFELSDSTRIAEVPLAEFTTSDPRHSLSFVEASHKMELVVHVDMRKLAALQGHAVMLRFGTKACELIMGELQSDHSDEESSEDDE